MVEEPDIKLELELIDEESIDELLNQWAKLNNLRNKVDEEMDRLKKKATIYLKERKWDRYISKFTDISITISQFKRTAFDEEQLKDILTEAQFARVKRETVIERISIITPKMKRKMKTFLNSRKIKGR